MRFIERLITTYLNASNKGNVSYYVGYQNEIRISCVRRVNVDFMQTRMLLNYTSVKWHCRSNDCI